MPTDLHIVLCPSFSRIFALYLLVAFTAALAYITATAAMTGPPCTAATY